MDLKWAHQISIVALPQFKIQPLLLGQYKIHSHRTKQRNENGALRSILHTLLNFVPNMHDKYSSPTQSEWAMPLRYINFNPWPKINEEYV